MEYRGCDISQVAIEAARKKYPRLDFVVTDIGLNKIEGFNPDFIFSRDVILHQEDPFKFLRRICDMAKKGVFLRLRTRDKGKTVLDSELSCQISYGEWIPYIIINCDELVSFLNGLNLFSKTKYFSFLISLKSSALPTPV